MMTTFKDKSETLKGLFCLAPFTTALIDGGGLVYICGCERWLPTPVGNINENSMESILKNHKKRIYISTNPFLLYLFFLLWKRCTCRLNYKIKNNELSSSCRL